jgi:hypothetical protein
MPQDPEPVLKTGRIWVEAARRAGCRAVLQLPEVPGLDELRGEGVFVVGAAPHSSVFPACAAVVTTAERGQRRRALGLGCIVVVVITSTSFLGALLLQACVAGPASTVAIAPIGDWRFVEASAGFGRVKGRAASSRTNARQRTAVAAAVDAIARLGNSYVHGEWKR